MMVSSEPTSEAPIIPAELHGRRRPAPLSRADQRSLSVWFAEVDRGLLAMILALMAIGLLAVAVASPVGAAVAARRGQPMGELHYLWRQLFWVCSGIGIMLFVAMRTKAEIRKMALWGMGGGIALLFAVLLFGAEVNGSQRWIGGGTLRLQPSEFLKPMFAVATAWILSCRVEDEDLPVFTLTGLTTGLIAILLMMEPDLGQTVLYVSTWAELVFVAGVPLRFMAMLGGGVVALVGMAYIFYENGRNRLNAFFMGQGDQHQVSRGLDALSNSGLVGSGPFTGTAKFRLPEAHTDYIYSVIGEEFGLIACAGILVLYLSLIVRVLQRMREERDQFVILAGTGLVAQFGGQVIINIAVNLHVAPSKGMTLPFISYGGSSLWALSIGMGLLLALTRRNPYRAAPQNLTGWNLR
ncbi:MAG: FtsW/RodA/SpoVE family cell cycle protein [Sphingopyxis sp.]